MQPMQSPDYSLTNHFTALGPQILKAGIWLTVLQLCIFSSTCLLFDGMSWIIGHPQPSLFHTTQLFIQLLYTKYGLSLLLDLWINCLWSIYCLFNERNLFHTLSSEALVVFNCLFILGLFLQTQTILGKHIYTILYTIYRYMDISSTPILGGFFLLASFEAMNYLMPSYRIRPFWNTNTIKGAILMGLYMCGWMISIGLVYAMIFPVTFNTALASNINTILIQCAAYIKASPAVIQSLFGYRALLHILLFPIGCSGFWFLMERALGVCHLSFQNIHILYTRYKINT